MSAGVSDRHEFTLGVEPDSVDSISVVVMIGMVPNDFQIALGNTSLYMVVVGALGTITFIAHVVIWRWRRTQMPSGTAQSP